MRRPVAAALFVLIGFLSSCDVFRYIADYKPTRDNPNDPGAPTALMDPMSGLVTSESGGTASFTAVLTTQPSADVTVDLSSSDPGEGTVSPASLIFTSGNWSIPQTVTVTGVDDLLRDGDQTYTIITSAAVSEDPDYDGRNPSDVSVTNADDDTPGITVDPTQGLVTTEAGGSGVFTVVLDTQPSADVAIGLSSSDPGEGTVSPASVVFTDGTWSVPQTVTVTGVDDLLGDGDQPYTIVTSPAVSEDPDYDALDCPDVSVTSEDDEPGIIVSPTQGLVTTESGGTAVFTVELNTRPSADVTVGFTSSDTTEGTVSPANVVFTSGTWSVPQTVTVTGVDDPIVDGDQPYTVVTAAAASDDAGYSGLNPPDVSVTNEDDDVAGVTFDPPSGLVTTEAGGTAVFTVVLDTQPSADVTIGFSSSDTAEGTVSPTSVVFTSGTWSAPQTVTVTGVDDASVDGDQPYAIVTSAAASGDTSYAGLNPRDVSVTNNDNEKAYLFFDDFESGLDEWDSVEWDVATSQFTSGTYSITDSPSGYYVPSSENPIVTAHNVDLTGTSSPMLSFWYRYYTTDSGDYLRVWVSDDGTSWDILFSDDYTRATWAYVLCDLGSYKSSTTVKVKFVQTADADTDVGDGVYIDDIGISDEVQHLPYPFLDDFELGLDNWIAADWGLSDSQSTSGTHSIADSPAGDYPANACTTIVTARDIDLTGATSPVLTFWYRFYTPESGDYLRVWASEDGGDLWTILLSDASANSTWDCASCSLGSYKTSRVRIKFVLSSDCDADTGEGVYIDDVEVTEQE